MLKKREKKVMKIKSLIEWKEIYCQNCASSPFIFLVANSMQKGDDVLHQFMMFYLIICKQWYIIHYGIIVYSHILSLIVNRGVQSRGAEDVYMHPLFLNMWGICPTSKYAPPPLKFEIVCFCPCWKKLSGGPWQMGQTPRHLRWPSYF